MAIKWATFVWRRLLLPVVKVHMAYKSRLSAVDRFLEKKTFFQNSVIAVVLGCVLYVVSLPWRTFYVDKTLVQLYQFAKEQDIKFLQDEKVEFAPIERLKKLREVSAQVYAIRDQKQAMESYAAEQAELEAFLEEKSEVAE